MAFNVEAVGDQGVNESEFLERLHTLETPLAASRRRNGERLFSARLFATALQSLTDEGQCC
jgi:hypothetical protein